MPLSLSSLPPPLEIIKLLFNGVKSLLIDERLRKCADAPEFRSN